jgi:hypothetical protein
MSELLIAVVGALVGCGVTWLIGASDRAQAKKAWETQQKLLDSQQKLLESQQATAAAQQKIANLESERDAREFFAQFAPKATFAFVHPEANFLHLDSSEAFIVESIEYLTVGGASVRSEEVQKSSKSIVVPLSKEHVGKVRQLGPWITSFDKSAEIQFRIHIQKDGLLACIMHEALRSPKVEMESGG